MYFENSGGNSEKKIEIALKQGTKSLKVLPKNFWEDLVDKAGARILSSVSSPLCDSYLLSESSLFVFPQKFLMITSGQKTLVPVIQAILNHFKLDDIDSLFYEVKNAAVPGTQSKAFFQDTIALSALMPGAAFCLNADSSQQLYLFHLDKPAQHLKSSEATLEILLYDLQPEVKSIFSQEKSRARKWISDNAAFRNFFESFDIQDYSFQPYGYSLNAIKGDKYFTFHITPRERGSFASFESNCLEEGADALLQAVHSLFKPKSFQVLSFSPDKAFDFPLLQKYSIALRAEKQLTNGFLLQYFQATESEKINVLEELALPTYVAPVNPQIKDLIEEAADPHEGWLIEKTEALMLGTKIKSKLFHEKSEFQDIQFLETEAWGRVLVCDGLVVCTEKDEFIYHEMLAHVPLFVHPNPSRVLILGGADLGTAREVLKHTTVQECFCIENDSELLEASRKYFPWSDRVSKDERIKLHIQDPAKFVHEGEQQFDLILIESSKEFLQPALLADLKNILAPGGVIVCQAESPMYSPDEQIALKEKLSGTFSKVFFYNFTNLTYPGGLWSFAFASDNYHPLEDFDRERAQKSTLDLKYYNTEIHFASFFLPTFMKKNLREPVKAESFTSEEKAAFSAAP